VPEKTKTAIPEGAAIGSLRAAKLKLALHCYLLWLRQVCCRGICSPKDQSNRRDFAAPLNWDSDS
jgi:hypothetical protein